MTLTDRRVERLVGAGEEALFHGDLALVPWPRAPRRPDPSGCRRTLLQQFLRAAPVLTEIDPTALLAAQPHLLRHHYRHYADGQDYDWFARTSADPWSRLNRFPVLVVRPDGRHDILSGHHRCAAALLAGRPVKARLLGPSGGQSAVAVTPTLTIHAASADLAGVVGALVSRGCDESWLQVLLERLVEDLAHLDRTWLGEAWDRCALHP